MTSFSRSFKPPSYLSLSRRPNMPGRTLSNSSDLSLGSGSFSDDGIDPLDTMARSGKNTPTEDMPPSAQGGEGPKPGSGISSMAAAESQIPTTIGQISSSSSLGAQTDSPRLGPSRPIAIELPSIRKLSGAPVYTPPEPLSARGDLPGGYFPLHEDPKARIHRPHPFHGDAKKARHHSISLAVESSTSPPPTSMPDASQFPLLNAIMAADSRSHTPVASYMPSGLHYDNPLPMGKYYPTNYETRKAAKREQQRQQQIGEEDAMVSASHAHLATAATSTLTRRATESAKPRSDSDARRRLQQYQRDMIAQATMGAKGVLEGNSELLTSSRDGISLGGVSFQLGNQSTTDPTSPRLIPLGSPGPVTPMDLSDSGGGYLDRGAGPTSPHLAARTQEAAAAEAR